MTEQEQIIAGSLLLIILTVTMLGSWIWQIYRDRKRRREWNKL